MKRETALIFTRPAETNLNHLRLADFGVLRLALKMSSKASKSHLPPGAPPPKEKDTGTDKFNFLPEKETITIEYEIDDPYAAVEGAHLELYGRFREKPFWSLDLVALGPDWYSHGKHAVKWDGRVVTASAVQAGKVAAGVMETDLTQVAVDKKVVEKVFPDGYVTLEHTPYRLKLVLSDKEGHKPAAAWTFFHLLIKKIELELGPEEAIPNTSAAQHARDTALHKVLLAAGGLPAEGAIRQVFLISNIFKTAGGQMNDNTAFTQYKSAWEKGANIPIVAKIRLADSQDAEVKLEDGKGAVALGHAKFMWEWLDADEDVAGKQAQPKPRAFIEKAINYFKAGTDAARSAKDHTYPKGDNAHVDRGGKRGPDADPVFPAQPGYDPKATLEAGKFPFKVVPGGETGGPKVRRWAAFSEGWSSGKLLGQTGVIFQPSRMAGDDFTLTVYLTSEKSKVDEFHFDEKTEPVPAAAVLKKSTGSFQIWRELHIVRYIRKKLAIPDFVAANLGGIRGKYNEAFVEVVDKMKAADNFELPAAGYNTIADAAIAAAGNSLFTENLAIAPNSDHSAVAATFRVRTWPDFKTAVRQWFTTNNPGSPTANADADAWRVGEGLATEADYCNRLSDLLKPPAKEVVKQLDILNGAANGVTIIHFDFIHTVLVSMTAANGGSPPNSVSVLNGSALDVPGATRNKCAFAFWNALLDTFVHEVGHHLFLPHADTAPGAQPNRHDDNDPNCMMSYTRPRPAFCGLCQLRLRGWDATALNKTAASNKKP